MDFFRGFVIWGIVAVIVGALCFILWKFYFCRVSGFENRKHTTLVGCILIFLTVTSYLFIPLVLCKAKLFTETKDRFVDGIKNDIVSKTRDAFYEDAEDEIKEIVYSNVGDKSFDSLQSKLPASLEGLFPNGVPEDIYSIDNVYIGNIKDLLPSFLTEDELAIIGNTHNDIKVTELSQVLSAELERAKQNVVQYAVKYSKNRTLKDSLNNAFKLLKIGDYSFGGLSEENTLAECNRIVDKYAHDIRNSYIQNSLMRPWVLPIVKNVSMEDFTGLPADEMKVKAFNKAKDAFDKLFLLIASCLALVTAVIIFLMLFLLREHEETIEKKNKRNYMFEYNEKSFEEMNTKKI